MPMLNVPLLSHSRAPQIRFGGYAAAARTTGGAGGRVIPVTNTNLEGPGSLHDAVAQTGPRIAWVTATGTVYATSKRLLTIEHGDLTIFVDPRRSRGFQLAGGLTVRVLAGGDNTILYGLRVRIDPAAAGSDTALQIGGGPGMATVRRVAAVNCSFAYAYDDCILISNGQDVTIARCVIGPNLPGNRGILIDGDAGADRVTVVRDVLTGDIRLPRVTGDDAQVVNNVIAGAGSKWMEMRVHEAIYANIQGNYALMGPSWAQYLPSAYPMLEVHTRERYTLADRDSTRLFVRGNVERWTDGTEHVDRIVWRRSLDDPPIPIDTILTADPLPMPPLTVWTAQQARARVPGLAGAQPRDALDAWLIGAVLAQTYQTPATLDANGIGIPEMGP